MHFYLNRKFFTSNSSSCSDSSSKYFKKTPIKGKKSKRNLSDLSNSCNSKSNSSSDRSSSPEVIKNYRRLR